MLTFLRIHFLDRKNWVIDGEIKEEDRIIGCKNDVFIYSNTEQEDEKHVRSKKERGVCRKGK